MANLKGWWTVCVTFETGNTMSFMVHNLYDSLILKIAEAKETHGMQDEGDIQSILID